MAKVLDKQRIYCVHSEIDGKTHDDSSSATTIGRLLTRMYRGVDEEIFRLDISVDYVVVMTPGNSFHQLIHIMLHLQPSVLHVKAQCPSRSDLTYAG